MAATRLVMRRLRDLLRLKYESGLTHLMRSQFVLADKGFSNARRNLA